MKIGDYFGLGMANVRAHKKRSIIIMVIVGIIFAGLIGSALLMKGVEEIGYREINHASNGKVLISTEVDPELCNGDCEAKDTEQIKAMIREYGGEIIEPTGVYETGKEQYAVLPGSVVKSAIEVDLTKTPDDMVPILIPTRTAAEWLELKMPYYQTYGQEGTNEELAQHYVELVEEVRERTLGKAISDPEGNEYFVVGYLASDVAGVTFSLEHVGRSVPIVDWFLPEAVTTYRSAPIVIDYRNEERKDDRKIWATFVDIRAAQEYYHDELNYCDVFDRGGGHCPKPYRYLAESPFGLELDRHWGSPERMWMTWYIIAGLLVGLAVIVILLTYTRLLGRDTKVVALYHAMGATKGQIAGVYCAYLLCLSLLACAFALVVGVGMVMLFNLINGGALTQLTTMVYGVPAKAVWILGWDPLVLACLGIMLVMAPICTLIGAGNFSGKKLARRMK